MIASGLLIERLQDILDDNSPETRVKLYRHLNSAYLQIAAQREWSSLVIDGLALNGTICPADMRRAVYAQDDTTRTYFRISEMERYYTRRAYNYFFDVCRTPLLTGTDLATTINSTTVTSATGGFTAAMVGEYIRIGTNPGFYKITACGSTNSITLEYGFGAADWTDVNNPANLTSQYFQVRPMGTYEISRTDESGDILTGSSFQLWYLQHPLPVYNTYDLIMLPGDCEAVLLKVLQVMMVSNKYDNDALKQIGNYQEALEEMKKGERQFWSKFDAPRDAVGMQIKFGRSRSRVSTGIHDGESF